MLKDMANLEASCILYVKVGTFDQHEQSKLCILIITKFGIVKLILQHDMIFSLRFRCDPRDFLRQTSPDVLSLKE